MVIQETPATPVRPAPGANLRSKPPSRVAAKVEDPPPMGEDRDRHCKRLPHHSQPAAINSIPPPGPFNRSRGGGGVLYGGAQVLLSREVGVISWDRVKITAGLPWGPHFFEFGKKLSRISDQARPMLDKL